MHKLSNAEQKHFLLLISSNPLYLEISSPNVKQNNYF